MELLELCNEGSSRGLIGLTPSQKSWFRGQRGRERWRKRKKGEKFSFPPYPEKEKQRRETKRDGGREKRGRDGEIDGI